MHKSYINNEILNSIAKVSENKRFRYLNLSDNFIDENGAIVLGEFLNKNKTLQRLILNNNDPDNFKKTGVEIICKNLENHPNIQLLDISSMIVTGCGEYIANLIKESESIKNIILKDCVLNLKDIQNICKALSLPNISPTIIDVNLSHNNMTDQNLIEIIKNNKEFFSKIKKLILCSNYITEEGINSLINEENEEYSKIFVNLRKLDLSGNHIKFSDLNQFKNIFKIFPNLKTLLLRFTPFEKDYNNYLKKKAMNKIEENEKTELSEIELQFEELIEKEKFLKNKKIKIKMMNTNDYMHYNLIRKYFPYLLYSIKLETKFIEEGN